MYPVIIQNSMGMNPCRPYSRKIPIDIRGIRSVGLTSIWNTVYMYIPCPYFSLTGKQYINSPSNMYLSPHCQAIPLLKAMILRCGTASWVG